MLISRDQTVSEIQSSPQQSNYKSLNDKMKNIERMLQKMH